MQRLAGVARAYGRVIASPTYFPLWLGQLISNFGDTLHYIALVVLVFRITGQGLAVAGLVAAEVVPVLVLGPVAGVVVDRSAGPDFGVGGGGWTHRADRHGSRLRHQCGELRRVRIADQHDAHPGPRWAAWSRHQTGPGQLLR